MSAPAVAASKDGKKLVAAWMDQRAKRNELDVFWAMGSGGRFESDRRVHDEARGEQNHPAAVLEADGTAWLAWEDARGGKKAIWARSSREGAMETAVSEASDGAAAYPALAAGPGGVVVVYEAGKGGNEKVMLARVSP